MFKIFKTLISRIRKFVNNVDLRPISFYIFFLLPLIYFAGYPNRTRALRAICMGVVIVILIFTRLSRRAMVANFISLHKIAQWALVVLFCLGPPTVYALHIPWSSRLLGLPPDYLGMVSWLSFFVLGLMFRDIFIKLLFSKYILYICGLLLAGSLVIGFRDVISGVRFGGLMISPENLNFFALIVSVLCLTRLHKKFISKQPTNLEWLLLLVSIISVLASQIKIGLIILVILLGFWSIKFLSNFPYASLTLVGIIVLITILPMVSPQYYSQLRSNDIYGGFSNRIDKIYQVKKMLQPHNIIFGNGPSSLPPNIDNSNFVKEDIADSLNLPVNAISNHGLFIDFGFYFGMIALAALVILNIVAVHNIFVSGIDIQQRLIFTILVLFSIFVAPTIELTPLYFIALFTHLGKTNHG